MARTLVYATSDVPRTNGAPIRLNSKPFPNAKTDLRMCSHLDHHRCRKRYAFVDRSQELAGDSSRYTLIVICSLVTARRSDFLIVNLTGDLIHDSTYGSNQCTPVKWSLP